MRGQPLQIFILSVCTPEVETQSNVLALCIALGSSTICLAYFSFCIFCLSFFDIVKPHKPSSSKLFSVSSVPLPTYWRWNYWVYHFLNFVLKLFNVFSALFDSCPLRHEIQKRPSQHNLLQHQPYFHCAWPYLPIPINEWDLLICSRCPFICGDLDLHPDHAFTAVQLLSICFQKPLRSLVAIIMNLSFCWRSFIITHSRCYSVYI